MRRDRMLFTIAEMDGERRNLNTLEAVFVFASSSKGQSFYLCRGGHICLKDR